MNKNKCLNEDVFYNKGPSCLSSGLFKEVLGELFEVGRLLQRNDESCALAGPLIVLGVGEVDGLTVDLLDAGVLVPFQVLSNSNTGVRGLPN